MIWTLIHVHMLFYLDTADIKSLTKSLVKEVIVIDVVLPYVFCVLNCLKRLIWSQPQVDVDHLSGFDLLLDFTLVKQVTLLIT